jgi:hypothetical protein
LERHIREYRNGRDLTATSRDSLVIDLFGLSAIEVRDRFPAVYQWVVERVKPERDENNRKSYRDRWWIFGEARSELRKYLSGLRRYIATVETAKHRFFVFLDETILPDNMLVNIALDDAYFLGILNSRVHVGWALATGGTLEDRPRYNKTRCFETFPFPAATPAQTVRIRELGEQLDAHRKRQQTSHPELTLTGMYNVLEKLRSWEALTAKEKVAHEQGLVAVLRQLHDELDAAVCEAYGWPVTLTDAQILERLAALNAERVAEEARGVIRWLRPKRDAAPQLPIGDSPVTKAETPVAGPPVRVTWPKPLPEQIRLVRELLGRQAAPATAATLAEAITRGRVDRIEELLQTLVTLGHARDLGSGRYLGTA